jgi:hypothetical protein
MLSMKTAPQSATHSEKEDILAAGRSASGGMLAESSVISRSVSEPCATLQFPFDKKQRRQCYHGRLALPAQRFAAYFGAASLSLE